MKKILLSMAVFASLAFGMEDKVANEITQADVDIQNKISDASTQDITPKSVDDFFDEFKDEFGIEYGITKDGKTFYTGSSEVMLKPTDKNFARSLQNAYNRAMLKLQGEFIKDAFGRIATSSINRYKTDQSDNAREFEELPKGGTISQILGKLTQLASAQVDKALNELGVETQGLQEERKKELLKDEFTKKTVIKAFGNMSGLVPVKTVITQTKRGNYKIGVIAVMSEKTRQIAKDMKNRTPWIIKAKGGKPVVEYLPKQKAGFIQEYGIRLVYDENGAPIILSYGNWGYLPDANSKIADRQESIAKDSASSQADAGIIEFISTSVSFADERETGEALNQNIKETRNLLSNDIQIQEEALESIIDRVSQTIKTNASGNIRGIRTLKRWDYTDENGVEYVGVVRYYSYANYLNVTNAVSDKKNSTATSTSTQPAKATQRSSKVVNTIDDF
ncbi:hypothetical protein V2I29_07840 [Campylobacter sp. CX2-8023-23]|uniref:DUF6844 domain-containing protein n=1 Tax=Campylobacter porcelli TaxID=1660073 RepID=A0ABU7M673_9BACT|nr:hypothetical protein [Campylobacter sp. CX2-8023-23]MEE3745211.1 hypothetical protein [Campylobacter sp. CX2-4855-23]MEE3777413.1 hypothetical protein [Campylobacter sp. CX2-4080-23]